MIKMHIQVISLILTSKFGSSIELQEDGRCKAGGEVLECGLARADPPLEWAFRKF